MKKIVQDALMLPIFLLILRPLILRNYTQRRAGLAPDEWYWADAIACRFGYYV